MIESFNKTSDGLFTLNANENADQKFGSHPHGMLTIPDLAKIEQLEQ